jgi:sugar/nucleoside kinase (ribokinase family)
MAADVVSVVCCGLTTLDVVQVVDRLPGADEKLTAVAFFDDAGGPAANAAATASALGAEATLVTSLGTEPIGRLARELLDDVGVDVVDLGGAGATVSTVLVNRNTGQRAVVSTKDQYSSPGHRLEGDELDGADVLLVDGHHMDVALALAQAASMTGVPVVLDGGSWKPRTEDLMEYVDYAAVSSAFSLPSGDEPLGALAEMGCRFVAQTRGPDSILVLADGVRREVPVATITAPGVVDTLGAGDVLHGALATLVAHHGRSLPFVEMVRRAAAIATESCHHRGARGWAQLPSITASLQQLVIEG